MQHDCIGNNDPTLTFKSMLLEKMHCGFIKPWTKGLGTVQPLLHLLSTSISESSINTELGILQAEKTRRENAISVQ